MDKNIFLKAVTTAFAAALPFLSAAQQDPNWFHKDFERDKIYGISTSRAYEEIIQSKKPRKTIVVAIIDSGMEIDHEDLDDNIWTNEDEIPGNGIDDDQNGYTDDVHGWNFLVGADGENIEHETLEMTRLLKHYKELANERPLTETEQGKFARVQEAYKKQAEEFMSLAPLKAAVIMMDSALASVMGKDDFTVEEVKAVKSDEPMVRRAKLFYALMAKQGATRKDMKELVEHVDKMGNYYLNQEFDPRGPIDFTNKYYGNNHYEGPDAMHGTHVGGIVGAERDNGSGIQGIAPETVELMSIRAVPDGDERDFDVANAIYYAVDNGANIINMSFGKSFSPNKHLVDAALQYAEEKGVLVVHAAGNDSENVDEKENYPSVNYKDGGKANNVITVGASTIEKNKKLPASLSNYGKESVDIFAPGVDINSTVPGNSYEKASGTSMAAPMVSGVAALVWSYYPDLSAMELKEILLESAVKLPKKKVLLPVSEGKKQKVRFMELSQTGGLLNAYQALLLAEEKSAATAQP